MKKYVVSYFEGECPDCLKVVRLETGTGLVRKHGDGCGFLNGFKPNWIRRVRLTQEEVNARNKADLRKMNAEVSRLLFGVK